MKYLFPLIFFFSQICEAQDVLSLKKHSVAKPKSSLFTIIEIDETTGDTSKLFRNRYVEVSSHGVLLVEGHVLGGLGTVCGCEPLPHGYWIERFRNGKLKAQGKYHCNQKEGTWTYYYENGNIKKIESYHQAYSVPLYQLAATFQESLKDYFLLDGPYLEYYPNGQLKVDGQYKIMEEYSNTDTLFTIDSETYERIPTIIQGDFWIPKSKKVGYWHYYNAQGASISYQKVDLTKQKNVRTIDSRYMQLTKVIADHLVKEKLKEFDKK